MTKLQLETEFKKKYLRKLKRSSTNSFNWKIENIGFVSVGLHLGFFNGNDMGVQMGSHMGEYGKYVYSYELILKYDFMTYEHEIEFILHDQNSSSIKLSKEFITLLVDFLNYTVYLFNLKIGDCNTCEHLRNDKCDQNLKVNLISKKRCGFYDYTEKRIKEHLPEYLYAVNIFGESVVKFK